jgi:hypothetical protein
MVVGIKERNFNQPRLWQLTQRGGSSMIEVSAKAPKLEKEATILVDLGDSVEDAIARFGGDVVFSNYQANVKITVQSAIRRYLEAGLDQDAIQTKFENYKPGITLERVVDPIAAMAAKLQKMTPEEREEAFAALRAKLEG